jgi:hypothetical protein
MKPDRYVGMLALVLLVVGCSGGGEGADTGSAETPAAESAESADAAKQAAAEEAIASGAGGEWTFGAEMVEAAPVEIASLNTEPASYAGKVVTIEGRVASVCKHMGCWVEVQAENGEKILVSSAEHDVMLPKNCEGKSITVQGTFMENAADEPDAEPTYTLDMDAAALTAAPAS